MKKALLHKIIIAVLFVFPMFLIATPVSAQTYYDKACCDQPIVNPRCVSLQLSGDVSSSCEELYCEVDQYNCGARGRIPSILVDGDPCASVESDLLDVINVNFFGISLRFDNDRAIQQLLLIGFTGFLAVAALAAIFIGIGAAIQRAVADTEDKIASTTKSIQNAMIGFVLIILSIVIAQVVATVIGVGSIFNITAGNILPEQTQEECL